jgi:hypothetical protein
MHLKLEMLEVEMPQWRSSVEQTAVTTDKVCEISSTIMLGKAIVWSLIVYAFIAAGVSWQIFGSVR